jgi:hypothetical protein
MASQLLGKALLYPSCHKLLINMTQTNPKNPKAGKSKNSQEHDCASSRLFIIVIKSRIAAKQ